MDTEHGIRDLLLEGLEVISVRLGPGAADSDGGDEKERRDSEGGAHGRGGYHATVRVFSSL
jgi:hypothetical protein